MKMGQFHLRSSALAIAALSLAAPSVAAAQAAAQTAPQAAAPPADGTAKPAPQKEQELVVTGTRSEVISTPDRTSFSVANDLQVQTGSVADALRVVPGVEVDLQGRVSLRGDPGVEILIDGRPSGLLRGDSRGDVLLSMSAGGIERVEVITNPGAALSPEGSGGVINLVTKKARKDTTSGTVRATVGLEGRGALSLSGAHSAGPLTLTGDIGNRRMTGEGDGVQTRSRTDANGNTVTSRQDTELETVNTGRNARVGIEYDLNKKNRLSTEFNYREGSNSIERADVFESSNAAGSYDRDSEIDLSQRGIGGRATWRHTLPGKDHELVADLEVEKGRLRREVEAVTDFVGSAPDSFERIRNAGDRSEITAKLDYKKAVGEGSINLGYQGNFSDSKFDSSGDRGPSLANLSPIPGLSNEFEYDQVIHAVFGTYRFSLGELDTQLGLRLEQVETSIDQITDAVSFDRDYFRAYPTVHLGYNLSKTDQLRGSYSRRIQRPNVQDLNPYTFYIDPQNLRRGNPNLLPEVTDSFELGWQHRKAGTFYSLTGFYRRSSGGVTDILSDLGGGVFLTTRANLATAERVGVEAIANGRFSKTLTYNASATFLWNQIDPRIGNISTPRSGTTGTLRTNLSWQPTPKDFFQLNAVYSGKQLVPQGYRKSGPILNLGYRRKVNDRLSLLVTGQNVLDTARNVSVFETPTIRDRFVQNGTGRVVLLGLTYNLGGQSNKKRLEPGFDFQGAGETPQ
ncbi:MAG TPA: TonB-dependent receptor [Allosphingosinicella sp.]|jgi:outer membrane receptor protein involved in Fe transport